MLLDTNAISAWVKDDAALLQKLRPDPVQHLPSIALGEYRYGLLKSTQRAELEAWLERVETACTILAPDAETARPYARLRHEMEQPGVGAIPYHDLWIATLAEQHGLQVVSGDRHFDAMPGVRRLDW